MQVWESEEATANTQSISSEFVWSNTSMMEVYMRRCIALAKEAVAKGGYPYGALVSEHSMQSQ